ncbi:hypothetical protein [Paenibacillus polymyxa]|nr:hypothetical protein [Paenibacillus polymyxa]WCM62153.1 hypothetical protein OYT09_04060 [Paenibacillus polymyxa]
MERLNTRNVQRQKGLVGLCPDLPFFDSIDFHSHFHDYHLHKLWVNVV